MNRPEALQPEDTKKADYECNRNLDRTDWRFPRNRRQECHDQRTAGREPGRRGASLHRGDGVGRADPVPHQLTQPNATRKRNQGTQEASGPHTEGPVREMRNLRQRALHPGAQRSFPDEGDHQQDMCGPVGADTGPAPDGADGRRYPGRKACGLQRSQSSHACGTDAVGTKRIKICRRQSKDYKRNGAQIRQDCALHSGANGCCHHRE